jgi:AcrR family transcriptional regulator
MSEEQKIHRILEAAAALLQRQGVRKTGVEDIAASAHVSKVTLYKYFGDRSGLLVSVCACLTDRCLKELAAQAEMSADTPTRMMGFTRVLSEFIESGREALCGELGEYADGAQKNYAAYESRVQAMMYALIREGKRARIINTRINDECIYHYIRMGLCYYRHDAAYRERMRAEASFKNAFLGLLWRNIFTGDALKQFDSAETGSGI